jgi:dTDP-4-amino-4,6-dideoxygalactose transaminase
MPAGSFGDATAFSFFPSKNLGAWGDGGAIVTPRADVAERARLLRAHGSPRNYHHAMIGANSRLDALQAAVLLVKSGRLEAWTEARGRVARAYRERLAGLAPHVILPEAPTEGRHAYHQLVLRVPARDALRARLGERGIEARVYYPEPLHVQPCFAGLGGGVFPAAEDAARTVLSLPIYPELTEEAIECVCEAVTGFVRR